MSAICIKYRILPTRAQETALNETLDICRQVYNSMVNQRTAFYETQKKSLTLYDQIPQLAKWKKVHPELKTVHSQVLQNVAVRVELAGYPRLRG